MLIDILKELPLEMPLGEALIEADRLKQEEVLLRTRANAEAYRQNHMEYKAEKNREYRARKKLQAGLLKK